MTRIPAYCRHRSATRDRAYVELRGRRHYLGQWGTTESRRRYHRLIAAFLDNAPAVGTKPPSVTVTAVCVMFLDHADRYYRRPDGERTSEVHTFRSALRHVQAVTGRLDADQFGPAVFREVIASMVKAGWSRTHINRQASRVRSVFKSAASREIISAGIYAALATVPGLRYGRSQARETEPVTPASDDAIEAARMVVSRQVSAMIDLQLLTAMRAGEVIAMRSVDLDMSGAIWIYRPPQHKTAHRGLDRSILIGPRGQKILRPFIVKVDATAYLFSPADAVAEQRASRHDARRTPLSCGNRPGTNRTRGRRRRRPGLRYTVTSYRRAITRACAAAGVEAWTPGQLRHNAATFLRREHGIEAAQTILGHRIGSKMTEIYAEANVERARTVLARCG